MGRDILVTGALGVLVVLVVWFGWARILRVATWPRRYIRARGYEHERARHTAAALELLVSMATVPRAPVSGAPPWPLHEPQWATDLERDGEPLPGWADPYAQRETAFGMGSGSSGSDYHGGEGGPWSPAPTGGAGPGWAPDSPDPAPLRLPPGWTQPALPFPDRPGDIPDDPAQDDTWARLMLAWGPEDVRGGADTGPAPQPAGSGHGREDEGETGVAPRELALVPPSPLSGPHPWPGLSAGPGWAPTKLGTRFDAELAADVAQWIRDMNRDTTDYLDGLYRELVVGP